MPILCGDDAFIKSMGLEKAQKKGTVTKDQAKKINDVLGLYYFNPTGISTNPENFDWKREEEKEVYEKYQEVTVG